MRYRVRAAAFAAEPPPEDRILAADLPEVYRVSDSVRDWEALTRFTSIGFDERSDPDIGNWSGGDLSVLVADASGELVVRLGQRTYK